MERMDPEFRPLLADYEFDALEAHAGPVYGIWSDFRLAYLNPGWFRFARDNGGHPAIEHDWPLERSLLDCVHGGVRRYVESALRGCIESGEVWQHDYECSSASVYRRYHQVVYPLGRREGALIVNSLVIERPQDQVARPPQPADRSIYIDAHGMVTQCAHCRRVRHQQVPERWDWVPEWVRQCPPSTTHTFCPTCLGFYYPLSRHGAEQ